MEGTDVNLVDEIQNLHQELKSKSVIISTLLNELDSKDATILLLQEELASKNAFIVELEDKLDYSFISMNDLKRKIENKNATVSKLKGELLKTNIELSEREALKLYQNESFQRIAFLENCLKKASVAIEYRKRLIESLRSKLNHEGEIGFIDQNKVTRKEQSQRTSCENEINTLTLHDSPKLKELYCDYSLKGSLLESQIANLYVLTSALDKRGKSQEHENYKILCEVQKLFKNCRSQIMEIDERLATINEASLIKKLNYNIDNKKKKSK